MSGRTMTQDEFAELSDDDIMNMASPPAMEPETPGSSEADQDDPPASVPDASDDANEPDPGQAADDTAGADGGSSEADASAGSDDGDVQGSEEDPDDLDDEAFSASKPPSKKPAEPDEPAPKDGAPAEKADAKADSVKEVETSEKSAPIDYKAAYEQIMAPFKAAGKTVQLQSPEEVVQLMQMGAHYTKKMQALQPNLKLLKMLQNNDLLDEGKLSYLIDINRKDPAAIQKLVREAGIDPLDIDTSVEPAYQPGNHKVSDEEITFQTTLEDVTSDPVGKELVLSIHETWDKVSKEALFADPSIMKVLAEQKSNGIYDTVTSEIERRRTLGTLGNQPFLQVYEQVGKELQAQGKLTQQSAAPPQPQPVPQAGQAGGRQVLETRPTAPKTAKNSDKVKAASPTRTTGPRTVASDFNPLAMSDEEFEKSAVIARRL